MRPPIGFLILALTLFLAPPMAAKAQTATAQPSKTLVMGTGGVTGFYYPVGGAVCRVANALRSRTGLRCLVESTTGSLHNLNGLRIGDLDLAIVQSGWTYQAVQGIGAFAVEGAGRDLRALMVLHGEPLTLLARKESGIAVIADLKRRKLSLGRKGSAQRQLIDALMESQGWTAADFPQAVEIEAEDQLEALCAGKIDVAAYVIAHPIGVVEEALGRCGAQILEIDAKTVQKVLAAHPYLQSLSIPAKLYPGQTKGAQTFGMRAILATTTRLSNADAASIVGGVIDNFPRFQRLHPSLELLPVEALSGADGIMPLHDGARKAYRDRKMLGR